MELDIRTLRAAVISVVALGFAWVGFPAGSAPVAAQEEALEVYREQSGPFEVALSVSPTVPVVGGVHFSVEVRDAATMETVTDARVLLVAHDEDGVPTYQTYALNTPLAPDSYEGNLTFPLPARWTLNVEIDSLTHGSTAVRVPLPVKAGTSLENPLGGVILLLVIGAVVGSTLFLVYSARKVQRRRAA